MAYVFREGRENFPVNETELRARLAAVEKLINNDENVSYVNINFVLAAGQLMQDCGLITENNLRFLSNAAACKKFNNNFRFPYNPGEGALRRVDYDNDVMGYNAKGKENGQRFYHGEDRHLELRNGQHYLFSNDWYNDSNPNPNKRQFYNWLAISASMACRKFWEGERPINPPPPVDVKRKFIVTLVGKNRDSILNSFFASLKILTDNNVKILNITEVDASDEAGERDWKRQSSGEPIGEVTTPITDALTPPTVNKPDDLSKVIALLNGLHEKVDELTEAVETDTLHSKVDELTEAVKMNGLNSKVDNIKLELDELKKILE